MKDLKEKEAPLIFRRLTLEIKGQRIFLVGKLSFKRIA